MAPPRTVQFYRDVTFFSGGHLKVWDYFNHVRSSPTHQARIAFSEATVWDERNPWARSPERIVAPEEHCETDILFLAGVDWLTQTPPESGSRRPVVNLIQHLLHADPANVRYQFLAQRAIRICVSEQVADAIGATGQVNGPVFTVPNGIDQLRSAPPRSKQGAPADQRDIDVLIVANKAPRLGHRLLSRLQRPGRDVQLVTTALPRVQFLDRLARAHVTVFAPNPVEGFYLPALEGMALGTIVVCADCVGNRSFCDPGVNCYRPRFAEDALVADVEAALGLDPTAAAQLLYRARRTAEAHSLETERHTFLDILENVDAVWAGAA